MTAAIGPGEKRCPSGIEGLDRIIGGGFPTGGAIHVAGSCGSGKTTLAMEFLVRGAAAGQKGLYVSTKHAPEKIINSVVRFDVFDEKMLHDKMLRLVDVGEIIDLLTHPTRPIGNSGAQELVGEIEKIVQKNGIKRLVIDSTTPLLLNMEPDAGRDFLKFLGDVMHTKKCTMILTSDVEDGECMSQIPCSGAIRLANMERRGDILRVLQVLKMAGVPHSRSRYVFDITPSGILMTPLLRGGQIQ